MTFTERLIAGEVALADYPIALSFIRDWANWIKVASAFDGSEVAEMTKHQMIVHTREREGDEAADTLAAVLLGDSNG